MAAASPAAFVPNWDGHTDSTVISYTLVERSSVQVRIVDSRGLVVATIDSGLRPAGTQLATWDGRDSSGIVRSAGTYRVRVDAVPRPAPTQPGAPGAASLGGVVVSAAQGATITLQRPAVAVRGVQLTRTTLGRSRSVAGTNARFALSTNASVSAAIVNQRGIAIRTLATGRMRAGAHNLSWDGTRLGGAPMPDGSYSLVIAATGSGSPTTTTRLPIRVDRRLPKLRATQRTTVRAIGQTRDRFGLTAVVSEPARLTVRAGRRSIRLTLGDAGTHRLSIDPARLGIRAAPRGQSLKLTIVATDDAGNNAVVTSTLLVPARSKQLASKPPAAIQPVVPPGQLLWPIGGAVTSTFGMRWGRPHTGIDISAPTGTPIHPAAPGKIAFIGAYGGYGNLVMVDHPSLGLRTYYAHMSAFGGYSTGATVGPSDVIGLVGCTGSCTGPHLHFETRVGPPPADVPADPARFLVTR